MDKNFDHLSDLSKEDYIKNTEKKISSGINMKNKLNLLKNLIEENSKQVEENIHEDFNKLRNLLQKREVTLIKKLNYYVKQQLMKIDKEIDGINDKLDLFYEYQNFLKNEENFSNECNNIQSEEFASYLTVPRYQLFIKEDLKDNIKTCGILKPIDVLLVNMDIIDNDESVEINCMNCSVPSKLTNYDIKNQSESEDIEIIDNTTPAPRSFSSSLSILDEKISDGYENEEICNNSLPLDLALCKRELIKKRHRMPDLTKLSDDQTSVNSANNSSVQSFSSYKGMLGSLREILDEKGDIFSIENSQASLALSDVFSDSQYIAQNVSHNLCNNENQNLEDKKMDINTSLSKHNNYIFDFNASVKNILGNVNTCRKECLAQKEIDAFCSKIHILL